MNRISAHDCRTGGSLESLDAPHTVWTNPMAMMEYQQLLEASPAPGQYGNMRPDCAKDYGKDPSTKEIVEATYLGYRALKEMLASQGINALIEVRKFLNLKVFMCA
eukprot:c17409_g1_i2 orf=465-782(+)